MKSSVLHLNEESGPRAAIAAMDEKAARDFLVGESGDPVQMVERLEERLLAEEE